MCAFQPILFLVIFKIQLSQFRSPKKLASTRLFDYRTSSLGPHMFLFTVCLFVFLFV